MSFHLPTNTQRRAHRKSRRGCDSCKKRHIKCDEARPNCNACSKSDRECRYVSTPTQQRRAQRTPHAAHAFQHTFLIPMSNTTPVQLSASDRDIQAFDAFIHLTLPIMDQAFVTHAWTGILLRTQYQQPFLRQCCIAIGATHATLERNDSAGSTTLSMCQSEYVRALSMTRRAIARKSCSGASIMLACALLTLYSSIQGEGPDLNAHLVLGMNLLQDERRSYEEETAWGVLRSLGYLFLAADHAASYHSSLQQLLMTYSMTPTLSAPVDLFSARTSLHKILPSVTAFKKTIQLGGLDRVFDRVAAQSRIQSALSEWRSHVTPLAHSSSNGLEDVSGYALLIALSLHASLKLKQAVLACDCQLGNYSAELHELFQWLATFVNSYHWPSKGLSWNTGLLPMLFFVATKCTDAGLQKRAIELLRRVPRREAFWDANTMLHTLEKDFIPRTCNHCKIPT